MGDCKCYNRVEGKNERGLIQEHDGARPSIIILYLYIELIHRLTGFPCILKPHSRRAIVYPPDVRVPVRTHTISMQCTKEHDIPTRHRR